MANLLYDSKDIPIHPGDLLRSPHFIGRRGKKHYLYHTVVNVGYRFDMVPTSHLELTLEGRGGRCPLNHARASVSTIIHGHGPGDILSFEDRPKKVDAHPLPRAAGPEGHFVSYVPTHLEYRDRQYDGWPTGITVPGKEWATTHSRLMMGSHEKGTVDLEAVRYRLFSKSDPDRPEDFKSKPLYDFQYAVADRSLRAAGGRQVWVLE